MFQWAAKVHGNGGRRQGVERETAAGTSGKCRAVRIFLGNGCRIVWEMPGGENLPMGGKMDLKRVEIPRVNRGLNEGKISMEFPRRIAAQ